MLPKNLQYSGKKDCAPARRFRSNIQPQQGGNGYTAGTTITVNVPTRANQVLITTESFLKFKLTLTNGNATAMTYARFDSCGAHALFERIRIYHGSNLLEDCASYGELAKIMMDYVAPLDRTQGAMSITSGTRNDYVVVPNTVVADFGADET